MITVKQTKRAGGGGEEAGRRGPVHREIGSQGGGLRGERGGTKDAGEGRRGGGESGPPFSGPLVYLVGAKVFASVL